jgi:molybdopterin converting factor small subunit
VAIRVIFLAQARSAAGLDETSLECSDGIPLAQALELLAAKYGAALRRILLDPQGTPQPAVMLFVNDEQTLGASTFQLCDGDTLTIMPPISGG